jgi:tetrahydromethanopterin S-methyltransferase subunit F
MVEDFPEFGNGELALMRVKVSLSSDVYGIQTAVGSVPTYHAQLIGY